MITPTKANKRKPEPRQTILCRCGAQWHGRSTVGNPVIADHRVKCGPPITAADFKTLSNRSHGRINFPSSWADAECRQAIAFANRIGSRMKYLAGYIVKRYAPPIGRPDKPPRISLAYWAWSLPEAITTASQERQRLIAKGPALVWVENKGQPATR